MMLKRKQFRISSNEYPIESVLSVHCAVYDTFVLEIGCQTQIRHLLHVKNDGYILRIQGLRKFASLTMISDHEVIVRESDRIRLIDLFQKHKDKEIFLEQECICSCLDPSIRPACQNYFFSETKKFCIVHHCKTDENTRYLHITYIPISSIYSETLEDIIEKKLEIHKETKIQKVDNYSSIMAIKNAVRSSEKTKFDLISQDKVLQLSDQTKKIGSIEKMWRINEDIVLVKSKQRNQGLFIFNIYLKKLDYQALIPQDEEIYQIVFFDKCFVLKVLNSRCLFKWFNYKMEIFKSYQIQMSFQMQNCSYDGMMLVSSLTLDILYVTKTRIIHMKDVYMQMLLHFNKDFDDDILLDMMNVLGLE